MNDVTAAMPDAPDSGKPPAEPKAKVNLGSLRMIARFTLDYPRQILFALLALVVAVLPIQMYEFPTFQVN
jgi:hypothetical protein